MKVTKNDFEDLVADFTSLLETVLVVVPHGPRLTMALMMFKLAESEVLSLAEQNMNS